MIKAIKKETIQHLFLWQLKNHHQDYIDKEMNNMVTLPLNLIKDQIKSCNLSRKILINVLNQCLIRNKWTDKLLLKLEILTEKLLIVYVGHMNLRENRVTNTKLINRIMLIIILKLHINQDMIIEKEIIYLHLDLT